MQINLGIIGAGRVAHEHIRAAKATGAQVLAICDCDVEKAQAFAAKHECAGVVGSVDDLLSLADLDAVVVAVPNAFHQEVAVQCLRAGKDVLLEKPMAMSVAECDSIIEAMKQNDRAVQMGFVCRAAPKVEAVRRLIEDNTLGEIYQVKASMYRQRGIPGLGRWFTTKAMSGGGVLIDIGVHLIDLVMHLTGAKRATTVSAASGSRFGQPIADYVYEEMWAGPPDLDGTFDVEDSASGMIRFDNGVTLELNVAWASNMPPKLMPDGILLLGDRGGCFFDLWGEQFLLTSEKDRTVTDTAIEFDNSDAWNRAWNRQHERFAEAVMRRGKPLSDAAAGRAVQAIVQAMYESSGKRREVEVGDDHAS